MVHGTTLEQRHKIAHDYVIANYVCASAEILSVGVPSFSQASGGRHERLHSMSHTKLFKELRGLGRGASTFRAISPADSYFSSAESLNHIQDRQRGYVGALIELTARSSLSGRVIDGDGDGSAEDPVRGPRVCMGKLHNNGISPPTVSLSKVNHPVRLLMTLGSARTGLQRGQVPAHQTACIVECIRIVERISQTLDGHTRPFIGTASTIWAWR